jgi:hypothetical protein
MKNKYLNWDERESIQEIVKYKNYKKISKGIFFAGAAGLALAAANYCFSGEPSLQTFTESIDQMNNTQLVGTAIFGMSSVGYFGGGLMYGLFSFIHEEFKTQFKKENIKNNIEKKLKE